CDPRALLCGLPLQPGEEIDTLGVLGRKAPHCLSRRIAISLRPYRPSPDRGIGGAEMRLQPLEQRIARERLAAFGLERCEALSTQLRFSAAAAPYLCVQHLEHG